jgi:biopolymer transport protein ExbB/TolQ
MNNNKTWVWVLGIIVGLIILAFLFFGGSSRQAYRIARGAVEERVEVSQERIDTAVEMATASVDMALKLAGDLPSQQAKADLVKQDIEEIGERMKSVSEARGDAAIERLDQAIEQYNKTLETVEDAANEATDPVAKSVLDRIYGALEATKEQLVQTILNTQQ